MTTRNGFFETSIAQLKDAAMALSARANLHLDHPVLTKSMATRLMASLRAIETMLRRLLLLMAAEIELAPAIKRERGGQPDRPVKRAHRAFTLMPNFGGDVSRLEGLRPRFAPTDTLLRTRLVLGRYQAVFTVLTNPERAARRMARLLTRLKRKGAVRPWCPPQPQVHRLSAELGLLASALPGLVNEALAGWYDTS